MIKNIEEMVILINTSLIWQTKMYFLLDHNTYPNDC